MSYNMEIQLTVTYFDGAKKDKNFKIEINTTKDQATIYCPECFTQLIKQIKYTCKNCKYEITDDIFT